MGRWCTPQSGTQETEAVRSLFKTSQGHIVSTGFKKKKKNRRRKKEEEEGKGGKGRRKEKWKEGEGERREREILT